MKGMLLSLTGIMLCTLASHSAAVDPTLSTKTGETLHAAVTDMPEHDRHVARGSQNLA
jgi:hypothetical protein